MNSLILRSDTNGIATLTLNRPEKRNAINREMFRTLRLQVRVLQDDGETGLVVIRGSDSNFSAGHDLKEAPHADALGWLRQEAQTLELFSRLRQPVIAAVEGICFTGGLELALAADFILCDETARFADTHGKWGLVPGWGMSQRLPRRVGQSKALEMMVSCRPYDGAEAAAMGLVNQCVPAGELNAAVEALGRRILANSWHSNAENKRLIYATDGMRLNDGLDHEIMRNAGFDRDSANRKAGFESRKTGSDEAKDLANPIT